MAIKLSGFIIALIMVSCCMTVFSIFIVNTATYFHAAPVDNSTLAQFNKLQNLTSQAQALEEQTTPNKEKNILTVFYDIFFEDGLRTLKTSLTSMGVFREMTNSAVSNLPLGESGQVIKSALITIMIILIILGVVVSALLKWEV